MFEHKYKKYKSKYTLLSKNLKQKGGNNYILNEETYKPNDELINMNFSYLVGPVSLDILTSQDKTIFAFGDYHVHSKNIEMENKIYLPDYLDQLFLQNSDNQFDLFIELPYSVNKKIDEIEFGLIENTRLKFNICFQDLMNKAECSAKYKNVRFHAIDLRFSYRINSDLTNEENQYSIYDHNSKNLLQKSGMLKQELLQLRNGDNTNKDSLKTKFEELYEEIISNKTIDYSKNGLKKNYEEIFENCKKIEKYSQSDFSVVVDRYLEDYIDEFYEKYLNWINSRNDLLGNKALYKEMFDLYLGKNHFEGVSKIFEFLVNTINNFSYYVDTIGVSLIDIYGLLRMTRCGNYEPPCKNLIILAGHHHVCNYIKFFVKHYDYLSIICKLCKPLELIEKIQKLKGIQDSYEKIVFISESPELRYVEIKNDEIIKLLH